MLGTYALSAGYYDAYYGQAQKVRTLIIRDYERAFADFDVLVSPTSPTTAFRIGRTRRRSAGDVPVRRVHDPGEPGGRARDQRAVRPGLSAGSPSACSSPRPPSASRRSSAPPHALEGDLGLDLRPPILVGV